MGMTGRVSLQTARAIFEAMTRGVRGFDRVLEKVSSKMSNRLLFTPWGQSSVSSPDESHFCG